MQSEHQKKSGKRVYSENTELENVEKKISSKNRHNRTRNKENGKDSREQGQRTKIESWDNWKNILNRS